MISSGIEPAIFRLHLVPPATLWL